MNADVKIDRKRYPKNDREQVHQFLIGQIFGPNERCESYRIVGSPQLRSEPMAKPPGVSKWICLLIVAGKISG